MDHRDRVIAQLVKFASLEAMDCYFLHGKDSYALPEDAINGYDLDEAFIKCRGLLPPDEQQIVENFDRIFREHAKEALDALRQKPRRDVVFHDPHWARLRDKARDCLRRLGMDLKAWEDRTVNWSHVGLARPELYDPR